MNIHIWGILTATEPKVTSGPNGINVEASPRRQKRMQERVAIPCGGVRRKLFNAFLPCAVPG